ncbi:MAG: sugar transferase [Opitutae bacterium]|nr:sugar transferase [Opitutae bacterium]MBT5380613.1 sugar transferase [Opitutae bacterium]MBT6462722.1 sugar transferase [Opitutae bacterium]MBT6958063.1 sugar transferase [Opitutae bacterium]MBT7854776.1 sugar transferase [Opitutae bacterium]
MKRIFDLLASAIGLLLFGPLFLIIAAGCLLCQGRPVLFSQERPGVAGKIFRLWKFRTMREDKNAAGEDIPDADRLTRWGLFLRATTLDELPQLWNVLSGEMSLVGPRPLLVEYLPLYTLEQGRRHEVRPGLTGWAQVQGRNALTWEEKFKLDVWYVDHRSLWLDLKILLLTVITVLSCQGINQKGSHSMEKFTGNEKI